MHTFALLIGISWIAFWLYWIISATQAKKGTRPHIWRFVGVRVGIIVLAAFFGLGFRQFSISPETNEFLLILGFMLFVLGLLLAIWARIYLGKNWGMPMTQKLEPELVTSGPYRFIRHPIYSGMLLMITGSALDVNEYWLLALIVAAFYFVYSAVIEERVMATQFPQTYPAYKERTKMLVPFIF